MAERGSPPSRSPTHHHQAKHTPPDNRSPTPALSYISYSAQDPTRTPLPSLHYPTTQHMLNPAEFGDSGINMNYDESPRYTASNNGKDQRLGSPYEGPTRGKFWSDSDQDDDNADTMASPQSQEREYDPRTPRPKNKGKSKSGRTSQPPLPPGTTAMRL